MKCLCCILLLPVWSTLGATWTADEAMLLYFDAATTIRRQALEPHDLQDIVAGSLAEYVRNLDPHSRFFTAEAYARWTQSQSSHYAGVGMELARDRDDQIVCLPYPESPATEAGIQDGDRLLAVGEMLTRSLDLVSLGMQVRGPPESTVSLRVQSGDGAARDLKIVRRQVHAPSVVGEARDGLHWIRVYRFTASTAAELARALAPVPPEQPVVIDLRGNPGGSLYDAIDAADLFLPIGSPIAAIRTREQTHEHLSKKPPRFSGIRLWLLQDERTASAAELFAAALTGHARATSLGTRTAGKGTTQSVITLVDGSALLLTVGELLGPAGTSYDATGLEPSIPLVFNVDGLTEQVRRVIQAAP